MLKNNRYQLVVLLGLAVTLMRYAIHPVTTFDTFFGLKIGELILKTGQLPLKEIFSWSAQGRDIVPYEWLAQIWVAILFKLGGFMALETYVGVMMAGLFLLLYRCMKAMGRDFESSVVLAVLGATAVYDFFVARPQIISYLAFIGFILIIFEYILSNKNKLWITPVIMYIWANSHASFVMGLGFLGIYAIIGGIRKGRVTFRTLLLWLFVNFGITLLPPLGIRLYSFLWNFTSDLKFMTVFVSEWAPLSTNPTYEIFYLLVVLITILLSTYFLVKSKNFVHLGMAVPFLAIIGLSFQALRHVPLGVMMSVLTLGWIIPRKKFPILLIVVLLGVSVFFAVYKKQPVFDTIWKIPSISLEKDMGNLIKMDLKGRMYNEFAVGGYLLYYLYPKYQIFIDGRADIYSCCEMREYWKVITAKPLAHQEFGKAVKQFTEKYNFSYMILPIYSFNPMDDKAGMMASTVLEDPKWRMVYFSDLIQVLVKDDGENQGRFSRGVKVVTPYGLSQFPRGKEGQARLEYEQMVMFVDSGISRTALGNLDLVDKNYDKARVNFETATKLAPMLGRPWVGLAELDVIEGKNNDAVNKLKYAINISPFLGEAYLKLANIYIKDERPGEARAVLEKGLKQNIDFVSLREMAKLVNSLGLE